MAFIDENDLKQPEAGPKVVYRDRPRSRLVPALLITLNVGVLALVAVFAWPYLPGLAAGDDGDAATRAQVSADDLDPSQLVTPTGRELDVVEFGGYLFEVTRVAYTPDPASRKVTITVPAARPGGTPQQGIYHERESFAGGALRIVDITRAGVMIEADGAQKMFTVDGAVPDDVWDKAPPGKSIIPPSRTDFLPDLPEGQTSPPRNPVEEEDEEPARDGESRLVREDDEEGRTIDDLPNVRETKLHGEEFSKLRMNLRDVFERDFVFGTALERDTSAAIGLQVMRLRADSPFFTYGLEVGDVILKLNNERVRRWPELEETARQTGLFRDEIRIEILRNDDPLTFVLRRGLAD